MANKNNSKKHLILFLLFYMRGHEEPGIELTAQKSHNNAKTDYCYSEFISGTIFPFLILFNMECT